jgi:predicted acetyltransferase
MARILDVKSSLEGLRVYEPGSLTLRIVDPLIESNNGVFKIYEKDGLLQVEKSDEETDTILSIEGLTAILYGTLNMPQLRRLEWLKGDHSQFSGGRVVAEDGVTYVGILSIDDWFPLATPWLTEDF